MSKILKILLSNKLKADKFERIMLCLLELEKENKKLRRLLLNKITK